MTFEPRAVCLRCFRPESVCYCAHVTPVATSTRVVLLQHPRERNVAIGTARMASLCLEGAEIHVGVHWSGTPALARALGDPARPAVLLYPGDDAINVLQHPPEGPVTLVVVDGTWWQTKKVVRENPELAALPRYAFRAPSPSEYRIRKEPDKAYVSTIEALVHVLGALEGDSARFEALLVPFRRMIDAQIACQTGRPGSRGRHARKPKRPEGPRIPRPLRERRRDLVCVIGEANAWPYRCPERETSYQDELVHWVACRVSTGEILDLVIAPTHPLAAKTVDYVELSKDALAQGVPLSEALAQWRAFSRETDLICTWGHYAAALLLRSGGELPRTRCDLRHVARDLSRGKVGTLEEFFAKVPEPLSIATGEGRARRRLSQVTAIASWFSRGADPGAIPETIDGDVASPGA